LRVQQIGPPFAIYNYPASSFVASFIGQLNQIPVVVKDAAAGAVAFGSQIILTGQRIEAPNGTAARLAIRPEEIKLAAATAVAAGAEAAPGNRLSARVDNVTFLGAIVRVRAAVDGLAEGPLLAVDLFNDRQLVLPVAGEQVTLVFPPHACWVAEQVEA
jgi:putative spermidine/putrescine transport system ATP-binding protein